MDATRSRSVLIGDSSTSGGSGSPFTRAIRGAGFPATSGSGTTERFTASLLALRLVLIVPPRPCAASQRARSVLPMPNLASGPRVRSRLGDRSLAAACDGRRLTLRGRPMRDDCARGFAAVVEVIAPQQLCSHDRALLCRRKGDMAFRIGGELARPSCLLDAPIIIEPDAARQISGAVAREPAQGGIRADIEIERRLPAPIVDGTVRGLERRFRDRRKRAHREMRRVREREKDRENFQHQSSSTPASSEAGVTKRSRRPSCSFTTSHRSTGKSRTARPEVGNFAFIRAKA